MRRKIDEEKLKELINNIAAEFTEYCDNLMYADRVYDAIDALWLYLRLG